MHPRKYKEFYPNRDNYEVTTQPSITKPNLAMSMRNVVEKYVKGTLMINEKKPIYEPFYTDDNPNPLRRPDVDLTDIARHTDYLKSQYEQMCSQHAQLTKQVSQLKAKATETLTESATN